MEAHTLSQNLLSKLAELNLVRLSTKKKARDDVDEFLSFHYDSKVEKKAPTPLANQMRQPYNHDEPLKNAN